VRLVPTRGVTTRVGVSSARTLSGSTHWGPTRGVRGHAFQVAQSGRERAVATVLGPARAVALALSPPLGAGGW
jgi:hypothetical protein